MCTGVLDEIKWWRFLFEAVSVASEFLLGVVSIFHPQNYVVRKTNKGSQETIMNNQNQL